jgi:ferredoxin
MTKIYYFSGTGNSLWSAKKIARGIGGECALFNIGVEAQGLSPGAGEEKNPIIEADAVILLFPSYAYGAPGIVRRFLEYGVFKTPYIATFVTFGTTPGGTLGQVGRLLKKKFRRSGAIGVNNSPALYFGRIPAAENYIALFGPPKDGEVKKRTALQARATEEAVCCIIERRTNRAGAFRPLSAFVSLLFSVGKRIFYRHYQVSAECTGCGICEKMCPVSAVTIQNKRPVFSETCEHCQGCLNWCPMGAIHFGRLRAGTPRYHHPEISLADISRRSRS